MTTVTFDLGWKEWINNREGYAPYLKYTFQNTDGSIPPELEGIGCHSSTRSADGEIGYVEFEEHDYPFPENLDIQAREWNN